MKKTVFSFLLVLLVIACHSSGLRADSNSPIPDEEAQEQKDYQEFLHQDKKDELSKITENSFFDARLSPLAGKPVLLAAGVQLWKDKHSDADDDPNLVKFEIVKGRGSLEFFSDGAPYPPPSAARHGVLETLAMGGCTAFAWLVTDPDQPGETVVRATFDAAGKRAAFIDPQSQVLFTVRTVKSPAGFHPPDLLQLKKEEFRNSLPPSAAWLDHFEFTYPGSGGMRVRDQWLRWRGAGQTRIWMKEPQGPAAEAPREEEKKEFLESRETWRWAPPDFKGWVTHADAGGRRFGAVAFSQFNPGWKFQNRDQFQPGHWEFDQYAPDGLLAGPEEICRVTTGQESAGGPLEAELTMEHHSGLMPSGKGRWIWGGTIRWVYAPFAFEKLYRLEVWKTLALEGGSPAELAGLKARLERGPAPANRPFQEKPLAGFLAALGFSFQDPTTDLIQKLPPYGYPPGAAVAEVRPGGPAAFLGLSPDDIVVMADWQVVEGAATLQEILKARRETEPLTLIYWRQGVYYLGTIGFQDVPYLTSP